MLKMGTHRTSWLRHLNADSLRCSQGFTASAACTNAHASTRAPACHRHRHQVVLSTVSRRARLLHPLTGSQRLCVPTVVETR
jgi:hypothetical protein